MPFPFEEIARFNTLAEAKRADIPMDNLWAVMDGDCPNWLCVSQVYGPPYHQANVLHFTVTREKHDNDTYFEETEEYDDLDWITQALLEGYGPEDLYNMLGDYLHWKKTGEVR